MSAKQRHYASILKETDIVMHQIERTYGPEKENDYNNICTLRNMAFVELVRIGTPFIIISEDNVIRIGYDEKTYDMPLSQFKLCVDEKEYEKIVSQKEFKPIDQEDDRPTKSRFDVLKEKLLEYQNGQPLQIEDEISAMQEEMKHNENAYWTEDISKAGIQKQRDVRSPQNLPDQSNPDEIIDLRVNKRGIAKSGNTAEIGFIGLERGAGVTHTAIMFAQALARDKKADVAFFESNKHGHMMSMAAWITGETITKAFPMGNVDYYFGMSYMVFLSKYKDQYDYVVIDFGCNDVDDMSDFARLGNRFVVASGADWNLPTLEEFYNNYMFDHAHLMTYLIPYLDADDVADIKENIRIENIIHPIPFEKNPFEISDKTIELILKLCGIGKTEDVENSDKKNTDESLVSESEDAKFNIKSTEISDIKKTEKKKKKHFFSRK